MNIISASSLTRCYGRRTGIDQIDLEVPEGELFGFLGPNGAGKTTLIRILLGFLRPTSGSATVQGFNCWTQSHRIKREVGYLPGDVRLYPWMTVQSAALMVGRIRGRDLRVSAQSLAERFDLDTDVSVRKMSRGMRQKLGLILALAPAPKLLVLDEPSSGLDPLMQLELADVLREMAARGHTVFFSSHTLSEVEGLCQRVAIVRAGKIVANERIDDLRSRARRRVEIRFHDNRAAQDATPPAFLTITRKEKATLKCEMEGPVQPLLDWLSTRRVADLSIGKPDLETLFHAFYRQREGDDR